MANTLQDMGITMKIKMSEVSKLIASTINDVENAVVTRLSVLGEDCVNLARDRTPEASWIDRTGNLRSSIGYVIAHNGKIIHYSDFKQVKQGNEGTKVGKDLATEIVKRTVGDYVLVVVAGMNYAEYVEARDNKDVLATPELFARKELPKMMEKLERQIAK